MADITMLILADHDWFRQQFAKLDILQARTPTDRAALARVWRSLANKLDVHAYIEEKIFYPQLLERGADDPEGETLDAIGDHNDIRDAVRGANAAVRKNAKGSPISAETPRLACARHSDANTASSWHNTPPPRGCRPTIAIRRPT